MNILEQEQLPKLSRREFIKSCMLAGAVLFLPKQVYSQNQEQALSLCRAVFFEKTSNSGYGFNLVDDEEAKFLTGYKEFGDFPIFGNPIGRRYRQDGVLMQPFERAILYWDVEENKARIFPLAQKLHSLGFDDLLLERYNIPPGQEGLQTKEAFNHQEIKDFYEKRGGQRVFGLPVSQAHNFGPFTVQRFENMVLQYWNVSIAGMPPKGSVVPVLCGRYAKDLEAIPKEAFIEEEIKKCQEEAEKYQAGLIVYHGDLNQKYIYLTIDDGWSGDLVERALNAASYYGARLTFFPVGKVVERDAGLYRRAFREGHAIENHTYTHSWLSELSNEQILWEIRAQQDAVRRAIGNPSYQQRFVRPPGGAGIFNYSQRVMDTIADAGFKIAMWNVDSNGWRMYPRSDQEALEYTLQNIRNGFGRGSIILQHAVPADIAVLETVIRMAQSNSLTPITMREGIAA